MDVRLDSYLIITGIEHAEDIMDSTVELVIAQEYTAEVTFAELWAFSQHLNAFIDREITMDTLRHYDSQEGN